jgi:signal transduction histidine kinase
VLLLTPTGKDASLVSRLLQRAGCQVHVCRDSAELCREISVGVAAVVLAEEGLTAQGMEELRETLNSQPAWADLPLIVLTSAGKTTRHSARLAEALKDRANLAFLERPLRMLTLVSAVQAACRARMRQYEVRRLLAEAAEEVQKRDQFIAMLGHELRNPLAAIRASIEILTHFGCNDPELVSGQTQVIDRQSKHMSRLVDDLLDVARLTSGRVALSKAELDLREIVERTVHDIQLAGSGEKHSFEVRLPQEQVLVEGDPLRLEQILGNLLSNSVRYSPRGGKIEVKLESLDGVVFIRIKDEGEGIEPELLPRIFEPFVQSTQSLARLRGGLGLGLAVVRSLVELHGGAVSVSSDGRGAGSEFIVSLPVLKRRPKPKPVEAQAGPTDVAPRKILVVEDNADARWSLVLLLRLLQHEVFEAPDGLTGLDKLIELKPDVALIDIGLPGLSGYEVAARARATIGNHTFLIALTGYGQAEDRAHALSSGFDAHLVKPVELSQVSRLLVQSAQRRDG